MISMNTTLFLFSEGRTKDIGKTGGLFIIALVQFSTVFSGFYLMVFFKRLYLEQLPWSSPLDEAVFQNGGLW